MSDRELESLRRQSDALEKRILELKGQLTPRPPHGLAASGDSSFGEKRHTGGITFLNRACEFVAHGAPHGARIVVAPVMFLAGPILFLGSLALSVFLMVYVFVFMPIRAIARLLWRQLNHESRS